MLIGSGTSGHWSIYPCDLQNRDPFSMTHSEVMLSSSLPSLLFLFSNVLAMVVTGRELYKSSKRCGGPSKHFKFENP